jgi:cyanamide hydratase
MQREIWDSAVERDINRLLHSIDVKAPQYFSIQSIQVPNSKLVEDAVKFVKEALDEPIYNHSQRVYLIGNLLQKNQFPDWKVDMEQYFLTCIFHDIGLAPRYHLNTPMSFEFKGGFIAHQFITSNQGSAEVADRVAEAAMNHTISFDGKIPPMGKLMQMSASLDVSGRTPHLCHSQSIGEILDRWPLQNFHHCFADLMDLELKHKPGCLTTEAGEGYTDYVRSVDPYKIFDITKPL